MVMKNFRAEDMPGKAKKSEPKKAAPAVKKDETDKKAPAKRTTTAAKKTADTKSDDK